MSYPELPRSVRLFQVLPEGRTVLLSASTNMLPTEASYGDHRQLPATANLPGELE